MMQCTRYIPDFFRERVLWVLWRLELDQNGRWTKIPYSAVRSGKASSTDPNTWSTYSEAVSAYEEAKGTPKEYSGLGVVLSKSLNCIFIDVDHCINLGTGEISQAAEEIMNIFPDTYCEVSQSGEGLHFFVLGTIPKGFKNSKFGVEMYFTGRYCAFTGNALQPLEPKENQEGLNYAFSKYKTPDAVKMPSVIGSVLPPSFSSDQEILQKVLNQKKYADLFAGKWNGYFSSQSEADISLCEAIAFWCERDQATIDRIFRCSALYRPKWDEKRGSETYGNRTVSIACGYLKETYTEWRKRKNDENIKCILSEW